jgi:SAM-dependent methyltransferase
MTEGFCDVRAYALLHQGTPGDLAFYIERCRGTSTILELGCGYGRLLFPLAEQGFVITGMDVHPGMLDVIAMVEDRFPLAEGNIQLVQSEMQSFELGTTFDRILIPYNGLFCLLNDEDVVECFKTIRKHLKPDGKLIFDVYTMDLEGDEEGIEEEAKPDYLVTLQDDEHEVKVYEQHRWDFGKQRVDVTYQYFWEEAAKLAPVSYTIPQRYLFPKQLQRLLKEAGLQVETMEGGFLGEPFDEDSPQCVVTATLA